MILFVLVALGAIGALIGNRTGHAGFGFVAGCLLGPVGWLLTLPLKPTKRYVERQRARLGLLVDVPAATRVTPPSGEGSIVDRMVAELTR